MIRYRYSIFIIFFLLALSFVFSNDYNLRIIAIKDKLDTLHYLGLDTSRIDDSLYIVKSKYIDANYYDANDLNTRISNVEFLISLAFDNYDQLKLLKIDIDKLSSSDKQSVIDIYDNAVIDMNTGRYEDSLDEVSLARKKLSELESLQIKALTISDQLEKSVKDFILRFWLYIIITVVFLFVSYLLLRKKIMLYVLNYKLNKSINKKNSLESLIKDLQKNYFSNGSVTETEYNVKFARYESVMVDIEKKIAIINKDIALISKK